MAVDQVSARSVLALNAAGAQDAGHLREGTQLEGRVLSINGDESLRLATRYGVLDVEQSQVSVAGAGHGHGRGKLPVASELIGTIVKFEVAGQSALGRLLVRALTSGDTSAPGTPPQETVTPDAEISTRIATDVSQAAARQDGLAPVFAAARQLAESGVALPDTVSSALQDLAGLTLNGAGPVSTQDLSNAVFSSGLFFEAKLARWAAAASAEDPHPQFDPDVPLASQDLKAALFGLKSALNDWIATTDAAEAAARAAAGTDPTPAPTDRSPLPTGDPAAGAEPLTGLAENDTVPAAAPGLDTEALFAVLRPPPTVTTANQPQLPLADAITLATLGEWLQSVGQMPAGGGRRGAYGGRPGSPDRAALAAQIADPAPTRRPPPPRRGSLPQGQAAVRSPRPADRQPIALARALAMKVGDALARVSLGQYASLPERATAGAATATAGNAAKPPASWLFEVPLRIGDDVNIAQFEIDQVFDGSPGALAEGRAWRVQFSVDAAPMGPVHVRLILAQQRLSIGLWAEDTIGAAMLQRGLYTLRRSLEAASFAIDEIHFSAGRPPSGPPVRAGGFIDRNA